MCSTMQSKRRRKRKSPKESKATTEIQPFPNSGGAGVSALSQDRSALNGRATAYVCQNIACQLLVHTPEKLRAQLLQPSLD